MKLRDQICLIWISGGGQLVIGGIFNLAWMLLIAFSRSYALPFYALILKVPFTALTFFLAQRLKSRDSCFFYINLGWSKWKVPIIVVAIDFVLFLILIIIALLLHG